MTRTIWVKAAPHSRPTLAGKARIRKPWQKDRWFDETPTAVEYNAAIARMLLRGDLVECDPLSPSLPEAVPLESDPKPEVEPEEGHYRSDR